MKSLDQQLAEAKVRNELASEKLRAARLRMQQAVLRKLAGTTKNVASEGWRKGGYGGWVGRRTDRYESATRTRLRPGPAPRDGNADAHLTYMVRGSLRRACQDLERNSSIGRIVIRRAQDLIVGDGPVVTATTQDPEWNAVADRMWNRWADLEDPGMVGWCDVTRRRSLAQILAGIVSAWTTDGDQLIVLTRGGELQVVESELVVTPGMYGASSVVNRAGTRTVDGVTMTPAGAPITYHVGRWDQWGRLDASAPTPVKAENAMLVCNPIGERTGRTRGEPALQAVLRRIERLDAYEEKVAVAAEIATLFSAIVRTKDPAATQSMFEAGAEQPEKANANAPNVMDMEAGTINFLDNADDVTALKPEFPTTNFRDYVLYHIMVIGAELGLPLVASLFDASTLSWSNIKALLNMSYRSLEPSQALLARVVRWVRRWKIEEWMNSGLLPSRDDYDACSIVFPRAPVVDFKSEVEGYSLAVEKGAMTRDQMCQALGSGRFADVAGTLATEEQMLRDLKVTIVYSPGATLGGGGGTGAGNGGGADGGGGGGGGSGTGSAGSAQTVPLNGAQITAAIDVLGKAREGALSNEAAAELLAQIGIERGKAVTIVNSLQSLTAGVGDVAFKREVLKALLSVPAAREAVYNATDVEDLIAQTGLTPEKDYQAPWIPVVAQSGPVVTGEVITDAQGDVVGGDVDPAMGDAGGSDTGGGTDPAGDGSTDGGGGSGNAVPAAEAKA